MRGRILLLGLTACGFESHVGPNPDISADGAVDGSITLEVDAAAPDAPPVVVASCQVGTASGTGTNRGQVGANGGTANPTPLACANAGDRITGVALRMSDQATTNGGRSALAFLIQCAPVTVADTGVTVGTASLREVAGTGQFMWSPATLSPTTSCAPGSFVSGIHAFRGGSDNLFLDVTIRCTPVSSTGQVGPSTLIGVMGTLSSTQNADDVDCNADEILVRLPNRTGAGLDAVSLSCSTPTCS